MSKAKSSAKRNAAAESLPSHRPLERFWPYVEPSPLPSPEELAALGTRICARLCSAPTSSRSRSPSCSPNSRTNQPTPRPCALARAATEYREIGTGDAIRHRARYVPSEAMALRDLFDLVGGDDACEVLIDDRPLPYARELWLPLVWFLISR